MQQLDKNTKKILFVHKNGRLLDKLKRIFFFQIIKISFNHISLIVDNHIKPSASIFAESRRHQFAERGNRQYVSFDEL